MSKSVVQFGEQSFLVEDAYVVGMFEDGKSAEISWSVEIKLQGEEVYATFSDIFLPNVKKLSGFSNVNIKDDETLDEIFYEGPFEDILFVEEISFGEFDEENNAVEFFANGILAEDLEAEELEGEEFQIKVNCEFSGIYFFTDKKENAEKFATSVLKLGNDEYEIEYEKDEEGGWLAIINY